MHNFSINQIVNGVVAGTFAILDFRTVDGRPGAQLKEVDPATHKPSGSGELWLPLTSLNPTQDQINDLVIPESDAYRINKIIRYDENNKLTMVAVTFKPEGFWSDTVTLRAESRFGEKEIKISTSSGGRDLNSVKSDIEAYANMAEALKAVTQLAKQIEVILSK